MKFWSSRGTIDSPVLPSCEQSLFRAYHSVSLISRFSHSFLLSALIPFKVPGWLPSSGCAEVCPSRSHRLAVPLFPFFPIWAESYSANLKVACCHSLFRISLFWFPETLSACAIRGRWVFWRLCFLLCFLFSFPVIFFRAVLIFFWLCAWKDPRLLMVAKDPSYLTSCHGFLFLLDVSSSGLQASWAFFILLWSPCIYFFGLGLYFSFWAWLTLLGLSHCDPFRPQQQV